MQKLVKRFEMSLKTKWAPLMAAVVWGLCAVTPLRAQPAAAALANPHEAIYMYKSADREAWLLERAKKEGGLTLYTSLSPTESGPLSAMFEKKYGIKLTIWRGLSDGVVQRVVNESRAKRHVCLLYTSDAADE